MTDLTPLEHQVRILEFVAAERKKCNEKLATLRETEVEALEEIQSALGEEELGEVVRDGKVVPVVSWTHGTTHRLNQKAFKKELPSIFERYYEEVPQRRFTLVKPDES